MKHITVSSRQTQLIIKKRAAGEAIIKISKDLGIPISTVHWHLQKHRQNLPVHQNPKGRPRLTTSKTDRTMCVAAKRGRFLKISELSTQFGVSDRTFQRRCRERGLRKRFAAVDTLTARHKRLRIAWCREHRRTNFDNWIFSDESTFELSALSISRRERVYRTIKEKYKKCCILKGGVQIRRSIMVWGAISVTGPSCFALLNSNVTSHTYIETLGTQLLPFLDELPLNRAASMIFQQDNAPPHRAHRTAAFLADSAVRTSPWPPLSPDLNQIEFVWGAMKREVCRQRPTSMATLRLAIRTSWNRVVTAQFCRSLYARLPNEIQKIISVQGARL